MKALRIALYGCGVLVALAVLAFFAAVLVVDGAFVKSRLEQAMQERGRTLRIEGEPRLKFFPVAGIAFGRTTLTEPRSERLFLSLDSAEFALRVPALVSGEVAIETLRVAGLQLSLVREKDGRMNFADLAGGPARSAERRALPALSVAGIDVERARVAFRDEASGQEIAVSDLGFKAARLDGDSPGPVIFGARLTGRRPDMEMRAGARGGVRFNLARAEIGFDSFSAQVKGRFERDTLAAEFSAPKVEIGRAGASGSAVAGSLFIAGPRRKVDARLRIAAVEGSARALSIPDLALDLDSASGGSALKARAQAALKANLERGTLDAEISAKLDESTVKATLGLTRFAPVAATFDIHVDRIDLDRYAPPGKEAGGAAERLDLSGLQGPAASGTIAIDALAARRVKLTGVKAEVKLAGGALELAPHSAALYGGTLAGSFMVDARTRRVALQETVRDVQLAPLLRDAANQDRLEGRASARLEVATTGSSLAAMKKALAGSARVELRDGAVRGFNLAEAFSDARSVLGSKSATAGDREKKTAFSEITATFAIRDGVARNDDLRGSSPFLRLTGAGELDIGGNTIDYLARASLVASAEGQGGPERSRLAGLTVPVRLTGALDKPDWSVDFGELAAHLGKAAGRLGGAARDTARAARDKIRGLLGR